MRPPKGFAKLARMVDGFQREYCFFHEYVYLLQGKIWNAAIGGSGELRESLSYLWEAHYDTQKDISSALDGAVLFFESRKKETNGSLYRETKKVLELVGFLEERLPLLFGGVREAMRIVAGIRLDDGARRALDMTWSAVVLHEQALAALVKQARNRMKFI